MSSNQLNPYIAPTGDEFIDLFQKDVLHFLSSKIAKNSQVNPKELSDDFMAHFFCEELLSRYSPDYNQTRFLKLKDQLRETKKKFKILQKSNSQTVSYIKTSTKLKKAITKKEEKLGQYKKTVGHLLRFKTYLFWCLRSYWWWSMKKKV